LSALRQQGVITEWHDRKIVAGTDWKQSIDEHLMTATVILLLISPDFLASDYCYGVEMQRALARHAAGDACVIPVILRPVDWQGTPFAHLHCVPTDARPVNSPKMAAPCISCAAQVSLKNGSTSGGLRCCTPSSITLSSFRIPARMIWWLDACTPTFRPKGSAAGSLQKI
jgi:hypothetical protein